MCVMSFLAVFLSAGDSESVTLFVDQAGGGDFITIEEAILAVADGDTIQIASGHYREQLVLEDMADISFIGSGVDNTFLDSPDTLSQSYVLNGYPQYPAVLVDSCERIGFSDLTLDGRGQGLNNTPFHGFGFFDSGGTIESVNIIRFREEPVGYQYHGNGVFAVDYTGLGHNLDMSNIQVSDFQKTGILLHGPGLKSVASGVQVLGQGPIVAPSQNGWQVSGQAELTADHCTATELFYMSSVFVATGILGTENTKLNLTDCDFDGCEASVYGIGNTITYTGGTITNPGLMGVVGKSFTAKSGMDEAVPQPVVFPGEMEKSDGSMRLYLKRVTLTGVDAGNSMGVALLSDNLVHAELDSLNISHFAMGLAAYEGYGDVTGTARNCTFFDNFPLAAYSNTSPPFDARYNSWGDPTGPFNRETNLAGQGNEAFGTIVYSPWKGGAALAITPASNEPVACGQPMLFTVSYIAGESTPDLFMYNIVIRGSGGLVRPASPVSLNSWSGTELFMNYDTGDSSITVTGSTIGGDPRPLSGPGSYDLFTIEISSAADGGGVVYLENATLRTPENITIPSSLASSWLIADCLAPAPVTGITADPHHNRISISWDHDMQDVDHFEVFGGLWHDGSHGSVYPEYDDIPGNTVPTRPADYAEIITDVLGEWEMLVNTAALSTQQNWSDSSKRGVYYYEVFAVDAVGNVSPVAAANDRAANYWLGDVTDAEGFVGVFDITVLGASFGESDGDASYNNICDYGPTDTGGVLGIPTTDDHVGFEDLMIVAMNFGEVSDTGKSGNMSAAWGNLAWVSVDENRYVLRLLDGAGIKGLRIWSETGGGVVSASPGGLLENQQGQCFCRNIGPALDVSLAVLGRSFVLEGEGDLLVVQTSGEITAGDLQIQARGLDNQEIPIGLNEESAPGLPRAFALGENYPNPFNPVTEISFSLPENQDVLLKIYSIDGLCVKTLVHEKRTAGRHIAIWNGCDDGGRQVASGTYFYRIVAGTYTGTGKMSLMK